ncbi:NADP-dependent oxidoreductase domain-containing protein [Lentinula guzmanii]|uniref:NADP-dependent oxidoreductase domain-containing protein n=1 Tax=Lentinula guzmanii TaxID=2804957 RepID=A0AA38MSQ5_9AGAR|nr:NADP-dependent oxidoreductase domain-containing protein [Lentinula guzmanii]
MSRKTHTSRFASSDMESFQLGPSILPRMWSGLWQLSSNAWGTAPLPRIREAMTRYVDTGYTAFADHYGSAEIIFGQFRRSLPPDQPVFGATKWCVFTDIESSQELVEAAVKERMERMQMDRIDLLQFHWQNYSQKGYLSTLKILQGLKTDGWISALGLCNFDSIRTDEICTQLGPGVISSNQVQFSLIDTRPLHGMADVCEKHGIKLLCYGTLCGGFLSEVWLNKPMPDRYSNHLTPSQRKYLDIIVGVWGGWQLFQELLLVLYDIGNGHGLSISNIATRWVLDHPFVGAVIIGTRLGISEHLDENLRVNGFRLTESDKAALDVVLNRSNGCRIITSIGDCGAEYR